MAASAAEYKPNLTVGSSYIRPGRTVTVKVKYADFQQVTRSRSGAEPVPTQARLEQVSLDLLRPLFPPRLGVRLLGVTLSNLDGQPCQDAAQLALGF